MLGAALSGSPKFFLGTDSAPHPVHAKVGAANDLPVGLTYFIRLVATFLIGSASLWRPHQCHSVCDAAAYVSFGAC